MEKIILGILMRDDNTFKLYSDIVASVLKTHTFTSTAVLQPLLVAETLTNVFIDN
jgi:hypothetical protein